MAARCYRQTLLVIKGKNREANVVGSIIKIICRRNCDINCGSWRNLREAFWDLYEFWLYQLAT